MGDQVLRARVVVERSLVSVGVVLLLFAGGAKVTGEVQKQRDLKRFRAALLATETPSPAGATGSGETETPLDTSLWSPERIRAYEESLRKDSRVPLAILSIPKIGLEVPVLDGTDDLTLNRAVGVIEGTARPGEAGNSGIAGHRDGFFRGLKDVSVGDTVELRSLSARHSYVVESVRIVSPTDVSVLDATPSPALTLVTCYPFYFVGSAPQRYVVRAVEIDADTAEGSVHVPPESPPASARKEVSSTRKHQ
jgi:sortase A